MHIRAIAASAVIVLGFAQVVGSSPARAAAMPGPRIVNGTPTQGDAATGALLRSFGFGLGAVCSGTLVGCRSFVTAAHCVCPGDRFCQVDPKPLRVFLQHAGIFSVDRVDVHPSFDFGIRNDVAVVTLAEPIDGVPPAAINTLATPLTGTPGTIVGFGSSRGSADDGGIKRRGRVAVASCGAAPFPVPEPAHVCWTFSDPIGGAGDDSNTCVGDSGGPLFVDSGSGPVLAGVTSGGVSDDCLPDDVSFDANVFENRDFVAGVAGTDLGAACGTLPPLGSGATTVVAAGSATLTKAIRGCRKDVQARMVKLVRAEIDAMRRCLDGVAAGRTSGPCPDLRAATKLAAARDKVDAARIARKCSPGIVAAGSFGAACAAAEDADGLRACVLALAGDTATVIVEAAYGDPVAAIPRAADAAKCQKAVGSAVAKYVNAGLRALASCRDNADKGRTPRCPDDRVAAKLVRAAGKLETAVLRRCADSVVTELATGGGFGPACAAASTAVELVDCLEPAASSAVASAASVLTEVQTGPAVRIDVPDGALALRFVVNGEDPAAGTPNDLDLYVRYGEPASPVAFDAASTNGGVFEAVEVAAPPAGPWWVYVDEVVGSKVPFQLTITTFAP